MSSGEVEMQSMLAPEGRPMPKNRSLQNATRSKLRILAFVAALACVTVVPWWFYATPAAKRAERCSNPECLDDSLKPTLLLRPDTSVGSNSGKFKILQIADIHLGEAQDTDWGPEQDRKTWKALKTLIDAETPDLLVFSGDQVTANNCDSNATAYNSELGHFLMAEYPKLPWAMIFGNHDDAGYVSKTSDVPRPPRYTRNDVLQVDRAFPNSLTASTPGISGVSNYILDVFVDIENKTSALQIYLLDSGGGTMEKQISKDQLDWLKSKSCDVPAVAFQHIPTEQFLYDESTCFGADYDKGFDEIPTDKEAGIVATLRTMGRVAFLAVGHNHGNDYCCPIKDEKVTNSRTNSPMHLCFGRHSGYGGYGKWERGARVYDLTLLRSDSGDYSLKWESWVRLESGRQIHRSGTTGSDENGGN